MDVKRSDRPASRPSDSTVLAALGEPTRLRIVQVLVHEGERACGTFPVTVSPSTLSHHFKTLREAGVIRQRSSGQQRMNTLDPDFVARFPGLVADLRDRSA